MQFGLEDFAVRVRQQTANIGRLVYQMIRPTYAGCCERKKNETIHSIKAIYPQDFVFLALTTTYSFSPNKFTNQLSYFLHGSVPQVQKAQVEGQI